MVKATQKCKKEDFLDFLKQIRRDNPDKFLVIILDNASIHQAKIVTSFCEANKIILLYLPPYSPNLNPIEFCWKDVKKKLSQFYQVTGEDFVALGEKITQEFLNFRCNSYTKDWRENFL